jgi:hypothetical protein
MPRAHPLVLRGTLDRSGLTTNHLHEDNGAPDRPDVGLGRFAGGPQPSVNGYRDTHDVSGICHARSVLDLSYLLGAVELGQERHPTVKIRAIEAADACPPAVTKEVEA